jgi:hypothetical protein
MIPDPMQVRLRKVAITHFDTDEGSGHVETWQVGVEFPAGTGVLAVGSSALSAIDNALARVGSMQAKMREMRQLNESVL